MDFTLNNVTSSIQADMYRKEPFQFSLEGTSYIQTYIYIYILHGQLDKGAGSVGGEGLVLEAVISVLSAIATNKVVCCSSS